jgi:hypothetical protein
VDIGLYGRVLWRFRFIVACGLILAAALSVFSIAKVTPQGLRYRKPVIWQSQTTMLLTQRGFPEGRALFPPGQQGKPYPFADPNRFSSLTDLYSQLANSDPVKLLMKRKGAPHDETIAASTVQSTTSPGTPLPVIALYGAGFSPAHAVDAVKRGLGAFLTFMADRQQKAGIPDAQRVQLSTLQAATPALAVRPRKKTLPIVIFVAILSAAIALAFILENLRPRIHAVANEQTAVAPVRRTA